MGRIQRWMSIVAMSAAIAFLALAAATASPWVPNTPLYTLRMEQVSSRMNFLPTTVNGFTYNTEKGYTLDYGFFGRNNIVQVFQPATHFMCEDTHIYTCESSCFITCEQWLGTCEDTCPYINTCRSTCFGEYTCFGHETCAQRTCEGNTCDDSTCMNTCHWTCGDTCMGYTCYAC